MALSASMLACLLAGGSAQISPDYSESLTLYHLNPLEAGSIPVNMDTGDERGDLYFYLGQFLLPIECADPEGIAKFDCKNPERFGDTVVTKVDMEIDNRYTTYSACNLCNGTDPFKHTACDVGSYVCDCFNFHHNTTCDAAKVGMENKTATTKLQSTAAGWGGCNSTSKNYECWQSNIRTKVGGVWYSTLKEGQCTSASAEGDCSWKVSQVSTINATCLKDSLAGKVEAAAGVSGCFSKLGPRNYSSPDWIECFMGTLLGPDASHSKTIAGMPVDDLVNAWKQPFLDESAGGCPKIDSPSQLSSLII